MEFGLRIHLSRYQLPGAHTKVYAPGAVSIVWCWRAFRKAPVSAGSAGARIARELNPGATPGIRILDTRSEPDQEPSWVTGFSDPGIRDPVRASRRALDQVVASLGESALG